MRTDMKNLLSLSAENRKNTIAELARKHAPDGIPTLIYLTGGGPVYGRWSFLNPWAVPEKYIFTADEQLDNVDALAMTGEVAAVEYIAKMLKQRLKNWKVTKREDCTMTGKGVVVFPNVAGPLGEMLKLEYGRSWKKDETWEFVNDKRKTSKDYDRLKRAFKNSYNFCARAGGCLCFTVTSEKYIRLAEEFET